MPSGGINQWAVTVYLCQNNLNALHNTPTLATRKRKGKKKITRKTVIDAHKCHRCLKIKLTNM